MKILFIYFFHTDYTNGFRKSKCKRKAVVRNNTSNSCGLLNEDDIWLEVSDIWILLI